MLEQRAVTSAVGIPILATCRACRGATFQYDVDEDGRCPPCAMKARKWDALCRAILGNAHSRGGVLVAFHRAGDYPGFSWPRIAKSAHRRGNTISFFISRHS